MPIKCSFCRRKYTRAGPYEKHLRTVHADLSALLASHTRRAPFTNSIHDTESDRLPHDSPPRESNQQYSDYSFDPDPASCQPYTTGGDVAHEPDTESLYNDDAPSTLSVPEYYPDAGESSGYVKGFEEELRHLCEDPWAPFSNVHDFKLASWFIQSKVSKGQINEYFSHGLGNSADVGYSSMHTLKNHLRALDPYGPYLQWFEGQVEDGVRTLPFFYRNALDCVRYLLRQIAYRDDFVYAPRREHDPNGQRVYAEMHTADWW